MKKRKKIFACEEQPGTHLKLVSEKSLIIIKYRETSDSHESRSTGFNLISQAFSSRQQPYTLEICYFKKKTKKEKKEQNIFLTKSKKEIHQKQLWGCNQPKLALTKSFSSVKKKDHFHLVLNEKHNQIHLQCSNIYPHLLRFQITELFAEPMAETSDQQKNKGVFPKFLYDRKIREKNHQILASLFAQ